MDDPRLPSMRAADVDRERVLEVVRQAHAEGRLSTSEFYERLDGVYDAKTFAELDALVSDLPLVPVQPAGSAARPLSTAATSATSPGQDAALTSGWWALPQELRALWVTWATVVSINVVIWLIIAIASLGSTDSAPYFWPIWVAGPWGAVNAGITATWWAGRRDRPSPS